MKYTCQTVINLPVDRVIALFDNPENLKHWMKGLVSFEPLSGTPGEEGTKSRLIFNLGDREIEMVETITVKNLPYEFSGTYDSKGVFNIVKNRFESLPEDRTLYISENEFQFQSLTMKLMGFLMPAAFKKQSQQYLDAFKSFAEAQG